MIFKNDLLSIRELLSSSVCVADITGVHSMAGAAGKMGVGTERRKPGRPRGKTSPHTYYHSNVSEKIDPPTRSPSRVRAEGMTARNYIRCAEFRSSAQLTAVLTPTKGLPAHNSHSLMVDFEMGCLGLALFCEWGPRG